MVIVSKLTKRDFIKASLVMTSKKPFFRIPMAILAVITIFGIYTSITDQNTSILSYLVPLALFLTVFVSFFILLAGRSFSSDKRAGETIEYRFEAGYLSINGESFNSTLSWDKIHSVTQTKNWIFIWHSNQVANPVKKSDIREEQSVQLKDILNRNKVNNNL